MGYSVPYLTNEEWVQLRVAYKARGSGKKSCNDHPLSAQVKWLM